MGMSWFQQAIEHYVQAYQPELINAGAPATLDAIAVGNFDGHAHSCWLAGHTVGCSPNL